MRGKDEFDWIDDPFNEKKANRRDASMGGGSKLALGCGCLVAIVAVVALLLFAVAGMAEIMAL